MRASWTMFLRTTLSKLLQRFRQRLAYSLQIYVVGPGIYTIPEISMVGKTEAQLTRAGVSYEVGVAHYHEVRATGGDNAIVVELL